MEQWRRSCLQKVCSLYPGLTFFFPLWANKGSFWERGRPLPPATFSCLLTVFRVWSHWHKPTSSELGCRTLLWEDWVAYRIRVVAVPTHLFTGKLRRSREKKHTKHDALWGGAGDTGPSTPTLGNYLKEMKMYVYTKTDTWMLQLLCPYLPQTESNPLNVLPWVNGQINWSIHTVDSQP